MFEIGDHIAVVSETIKGKVVKIDANKIHIEDDYGFERTYDQSELIKIQSESDYKITDEVVNKEIEKQLKIQQEEESRALKAYELDLHIEELVDDHSSMTNHEILTKQMIVCKAFVRNALDKEKPKIVLIHGKGEGVLKSEIHSFLHKLRDLHDIHLEYHDASFSEYGMGGATEILFH